jgi:hypothetical protein
MNNGLLQLPWHISLITCISRLKLYHLSTHCNLLHSESSPSAVYFRVVWEQLLWQHRLDVALFRKIAREDSCEQDWRNCYFILPWLPYDWISSSVYTVWWATNGFRIVTTIDQLRDPMSCSRWMPNAVLSLLIALETRSASVLSHT